MAKTTKQIMDNFLKWANKLVGEVDAAVLSVVKDLLVETVDKYKDLSPDHIKNLKETDGVKQEWIAPLMDAVETLMKDLQKGLPTPMFIDENKKTEKILITAELEKDIKELADKGYTGYIKSDYYYAIVGALNYDDALNRAWNNFCAKKEYDDKLTIEKVIKETCDPLLKSLAKNITDFAKNKGKMCEPKNIGGTGYLFQALRILGATIVFALYKKRLKALITLGRKITYGRLRKIDKDEGLKSFKMWVKRWIDCIYHLSDDETVRNGDDKLDPTIIISSAGTTLHGIASGLSELLRKVGYDTEMTVWDPVLHAYAKELNDLCIWMGRVPTASLTDTKANPSSLVGGNYVTWIDEVRKYAKSFESTVTSNEIIGLHGKEYHWKSKSWEDLMKVLDGQSFDCIRESADLYWQLNNKNGQCAKPGSTENKERFQNSIKKVIELEKTLGKYASVRYNEERNITSRYIVYCVAKGVLASLWMSVRKYLASRGYKCMW